MRDDELSALEAIVVRDHATAPIAIDFRVVTWAAPASPTRAPAMELYIGLHSRRAPEIERRVAGERDLVAEFSMVRAGGWSMVGDEPRAIVGVVPDEWVRVEPADIAHLFAHVRSRLWQDRLTG